MCKTSCSRVKLLCSYGGRFATRPGSRLLFYSGGESKLLAFDRHVRLSDLRTKLSSLLSAGASTDGGVSIKYQLPGEDLDMLVDVVNEKDLKYMMAEYDRLHRSRSAAGKSACLRVVLFPDDRQPPLPPLIDMEFQDSGREERNIAGASVTAAAESKLEAQIKELESLFVFSGVQELTPEA